jgi:PAS domain S-box-containing protein
MQDKTLGGIPLRTSLIYALVSAAWIFFSSKILLLLVDDPMTILRLEVYKGWVFVSVTTALVYIALNRQIRRWEREAESRKQAEAVLQRREAHIKAMLTAAQDGFWLLDNRGNVLEVNEAAAAISGYTKEELLQLSIKKVEVHDSPEEILRRMKQVQEEGKVRFETQHRRKDGREITVEVSVTHLDNDGGQYVCSYRDITDQKQAQLSLAEGEARFRALSENSLTGIYIVQDWRFTYVNSSFGKIFGYTTEELTGRNPLELFDADEQELVKLLLSRRFAASGTVDHYEIRGNRKDGNKVMLEILGTTFQLNGQVALVGNVMDITERKRVEEELKHSQSVLDATINSTSDMIWSVDARTFAITSLNNSVRDFFCRQTGITVRVGMTPEEYLPSDEYVRQWRGYYMKALAGELSHLEYRTATDDGTFDVNFNWIGRDNQVRGVSVFAKDITERKKTEEALRQLAAIVQSSDDAIIGKSLDGTILSWNQGAERIFGYTAAEAVGQSIAMVMPPERRGELPDILRQLKESGRVEHKETTRVTKIGRILNVALTISPIRDDAGDVVAFSVIERDITERRRVDEALERMTNTMSEGQRLAHMGTFEYDAATQETTWSEEEYRIYGLDPDCPSPSYDVMCAKCLLPEDAVLLDQTFKAAIQARGNYELEHRIVRPDGTIRWVHERARPYFDEHGKLLRYVGATLDITERKQAEQALHASGERLRAIVEGTPYLFFYVQDANVRTTYISPTVELITGYTPEMWMEVQGWFVTDAPCNQVARERTQAHLRGEWTGKPVDVEVRHAKGYPIMLEVYEHPIVHNGKVVGLQGVAHDVTGRKRAEEQMAASLREKEVLLKEIHHRVKNNLQIISSLLSIQSNTLHDESAKAILRESQHRVRAIAIVHERLYRTQDFASINFAEYLLAVTDDLLRSFGRPGIYCTLDVDPIALTIDSAIPCGLVVNELVTNALKHAFPGDREGTIVVSFHRVGDEAIELKVADDGVGLPAERPMPGMGSELIESLSEQIGGKLVRESVNGTSISIRFPG